MYKISVPAICANVERQGRDKIVKKLRELNAERVFLSIGKYCFDSEERKTIMERLARETAYFHSLGFEVGAWIWTFMIDEDTSFDRMYALKEQEKPIKNSACPLGESFRSFAAGYLSDIAKCGVDIIMFDDDFRYSSLEGGVACLCPLHLAKINELVGENLDHATMARKIASGGKNKYRDAWIRVNGDAFRSYAREMRAAVDAVNPKIRLGACACLSSWDLDGVDAYELSRILAGSTKPFVRLIGAPYWAARSAWGNRIGDVIEQERMEAVWTRKDDEIEIFSEGDCYPRPRIICPAAYVEALDTALRADNCTDGMLKYAIDYLSSGDYENGYVKFHLRNQPVYELIDRWFSDKTATGVRVYEYPEKVASMEVETTVDAAGKDMYYTYFSGAARSFAQTATPTTYVGEGVTGACFGEAAYSLTHEDCKRGMILDGSAAAILTKRGFDVGIRSVGARAAGGVETFLVDNEMIHSIGSYLYRNAFADTIEILSTCDVDGESVVGSYRYENAEGERFLVINADGRIRDAVPNSTRMTFRHYARARQYRDHAEWLTRGERLPAFVYGQPDLYLMAKKNAAGDEMAVGLWNFSVDDALDPVVDLDGEYTSVESFRCTATLEGDKVRLSDLPAFGFAAILLKK